VGGLGAEKEAAARLLREFVGREWWGWKDPRNCLTLPFWQGFFPGMKTVVCLRHPLEVVRSLERRGVSLEAYLAASGTSGDDLQRQMVLEAAVAVARELALEALADRMGIEISDDDVRAYLREEAEAAGEEDVDRLIADVWAHGQEESIRADLRLRAALDRLVADVTPIEPDLAAAREKLWTPDKEKPEGETKLWTPGSKENA
jgi:hypothetical protein